MVAPAGGNYLTMYTPQDQGYNPWAAFDRFQQMQQAQGIPTPQNTPSVPNPASTIANGLAGGQQRPMQMGPTARDTGGDPWGVYKANTRPNTPMVDNGGSASHGGYVGAGSGRMYDGPNGGAPVGGGNWQAWYGDDMGQWGGATWDQAGNRWVKGTQPLAAGSRLGSTGATLPVGYSSQGDTFLHEFNGQAAEPSWLRVNRWASDNQKLYGMDAQTAYNSALSRLKRDMGNNWQASGFDLSNVQAAPPGQDNFVPPASGGGDTPLGNPGQPAPTTGGTFNGPIPLGDPNAPQPGYKTYDPNGAIRRDVPPIQNGMTVAAGYGGESMANPNPLANPLAVNPDGTISHTGGNPMAGVDPRGEGYAGTNSGDPNRPRPGAPGVLGHTAVTSGGQTTSTTPFNIGNGQFADINAVIAAARQNPAMGAQIRNIAMGQKGRTTSTLGKYMDNLYGRAIQAALSLAGTGNSVGGNPLQDVLQGAIGSSMGNGAGFVPFMGQLAQGALGANMEGWDDDTVQTALAASNALQSLGLGDVAAGGLDSTLDDLLYEMNNQSLTDPNARAGGRLAKLLRGSNYERSMQRFAATR